MEKVVLDVTGMECGSCEQRIERALARVEGVQRSTADHVAGTVSVVLDPARTSADAARAVIEQAGFAVTR